MNSEPSLRVENLTRKYGSLTAIQNLNFTVGRGEVVGFLGPNGAGKSTTMRILSGLLTATSGCAWICGIPVAAAPLEAKRRIGYMPETNPLPEDMRVVEYLRFRARLKEIPGRKVRSVVQEAMEICDLSRTARRSIIGTLSKGFRQRVGVAEALLGDPELIIMDEPTIGLDPHQIQGIRRLIDDLRGRLTLVLSSHILPEIERCCDRVIIVNRGRLVASGTSASLREEFLPGQRFELEVEGGETGFLEWLKTAPVPTTILESRSPRKNIHRFTLRTDSDDDVAPLLLETLAQSPNHKLRSFAPRATTLEEIFLSATKRSWEETNENVKTPAATGAGRPGETQTAGADPSPDPSPNSPPPPPETPPKSGA